MRKSSTLKVFERPIYQDDGTGNRFPKTWFKLSENCPAVVTQEDTVKEEKIEYSISYTEQKDMTLLSCIVENG